MNCVIVNCVLMYINVSGIMNTSVSFRWIEIDNTNNMNYTHFKTNSSEMFKKY